MKPFLSPEQKKCFINDQAFVIGYQKSIPKDPIEAAIEVIEVVEVLRPIFEPTSADLRLGCAKKDDRKKDTNVNPPETGWHIRSSNLPKETQPDREFGSVDPNKSPNFEVATLSKSVLIDWVKKAFDQKCPDSKIYDLSWFEFYFNTVKTKIFSEELLLGQSMMQIIYETRRGTYEFEYPLRREQGQLWAYSPLTDLYLFPSFRIRVDHDDWAKLMDLKIYVGWSWWTQSGFRERDALLGIVPQIEAIGWKLEFLDEI